MKSATLLTNCEKVAKELNNFFEIVAKISKFNYENCDSLVEKIDDLTLMAIVKWRNHPRILVVTSKHKNRANFSFRFVSKEDVLAEIKVLDVSKAIQKSHIPVKIIKTHQNFLQKQFVFVLTNH